jgi:hypothetical protein
MCFQVSASDHVKASADAGVNMVKPVVVLDVKEPIAKVVVEPKAVSEKRVLSAVDVAVVSAISKEDSGRAALESPPMTPAMRQLAEKMYRDNQMVLEEMRHIRQAMRMRVQRSINKGLSREMAFMKGKLEITQGQEQVWSDYVGAVQAGAEAIVGFREKMHEQRVGRKSPPTSIERLNAQVEKMEMRLSSLKRVAVAAGSLYVSLSVKQQATADHLFRRHKKQLFR